MAKKLYRSRTERMIAGVCGGLAEYFDIDPTIVRLAAVALTLAGGSGILAYLVFWFVVPQRPLAQSINETRNPDSTVTPTPEEASESDTNTGVIVAGTILIVLGFIFLIGRLLPFAWWSFHSLWPLILIAIGIFVLIKGTEKKSHES